MSTQTVTGVLKTNKGTIPIDFTATDSQDTNGTTDATYTVTAQEVGVYGAGMTVTGGYLQAGTGIAHAYLLRNGQIASVITGLGSLALGAGQVQPCKPLTLIPGDVLRVWTEA